MRVPRSALTLALGLAFVAVGFGQAAAAGLKAAPDDQVWVLPTEVPHPVDNKPTAERVELGKMLFFDPRLSRDGNMSCATCHDPSKGWSDGLPTARGHKGKVLGRATPTIYNSAFNSIQMWDGRKATLEDQAVGPLESKDEMYTDFDAMIRFLSANGGYRAHFAKAYPGEQIGPKTLAKAIASFERTVVGGSSKFDRWLAGDSKAMTPREINGFRLFVDEEKGNCAACHSAPNFTDDGFHNVGLKSFAAANPDLGRFAQKPLKVNRGAFKTPTLRNVAQTAPYFHDGSAKSLEDVVAHYVRGGDVRTNLSPNMKALTLTKQEQADLVAFMKALTASNSSVSIPVLPN